ncbi:hypothetical protein NQD34_013523 [Periophthalmus magnuspinnatus]|nr:hypothetical protein NQD34_013523 [Periophthalmus magnuspinnatus]
MMILLEVLLLVASHLQKESQAMAILKKTETTIQKKSVDYFADVMHVNGKANTSNINATEDHLVGGEEFYFKEEAETEEETESGESDLSVSEKESEAKRVPHGLSSDPEENIESDSLLEMHYLRTSTGNVSFQSLNLNL